MSSNDSCLTNKLLAGNQIWSDDVLARDPDYFAELSQEQRPKFLWIGCSDSRVPAETVVGAEPGEIFVHRNIANQVIVTDFNCLSVIQYALVSLKVEHVIVCGHYGCGGIQAALQPENPNLTITNKWLLHIKDVYRLHQAELQDLGKKEILQRMVRLNILEQVKTIAHTSMMQTAWRHGHRPTLHGWVYGLKNGRIQELVRMDHESHIDPIYRISE